MLGFAFLVAVIALVVSAVLWFQWQGAASAVLALREGADSARKEAETARNAERKLQEELKARSAQLVETRERLADTRKRAQEGKGGKAQPRGAREAELEEDLGHARKLIRLNPREQEVPGGHIGLPFGAAEGIRRICAFAENLAGEAKPRD